MKTLSVSHCTYHELGAVHVLWDTAPTSASNLMLPLNLDKGTPRNELYNGEIVVKFILMDTDTVKVMDVWKMKWPVINRWNPRNSASHVD
jgi:hypothetical protein